MSQLAFDKNELYAEGRVVMKASVILVEKKPIMPEGQVQSSVLCGVIIGNGREADGMRTNLEPQLRPVLLGTSSRQNCCCEGLCWQELEGSATYETCFCFSSACVMSIVSAAGCREGSVYQNM